MEKKKKQTKTMSFLNIIEKTGNKLPHPITIFAILCLIIIVLSAILAAFDFSVTGDMINSETHKLETQTINVVSLLSPDGIVYMLTTAISNFIEFAPLGVVLVSMFGIGLAEGSGYISTLLKKAIALTPAKLITPMVVFLGIMSNIASDAGYVILVPLGALIFLTCGRHPIAGLAAAFAGVSGGFSANLIIGTIDPTLAGISTEAARIIDPNYTVNATSNWYFMFVSTFLITILGTIVTNKIIEPRLGKYNTEHARLDANTMNLKVITPLEKKALKWANLTLLGLVVLLLAVLLPPESFLRNPDTGSITENSPFMSSIIVILSIMFFIPSVVYGKVSKTFKSEKDIATQMGKTMSTMGPFIALVFVCAQFAAYFSYSNLGTIIAIYGADILKSSGINGFVVIIIFIILSAIINLVMGSAGAKWAILAPIFIPMFMSVGYSPELVQVAYRIGDSSTNIISPIMAYFAMIIVFAQQYDKKIGMGTVISTMLPYTIVFLVGWSIMLVIWMLLGIPLGPHAPIMLT